MWIPWRYRERGAALGSGLGGELPARIARGVAIALVGLVGCAGLHRALPPRPGWLQRLSAAPAPPAGDHWPLPPRQMEQLLRAGRFAPRATRDVGHGVTGAEHWTVRFPEIGRDVDLKWKTAPAGDADGWNNSPRRELAAYRVQQWFLSPREYVVPTTVARCLPLETVRRVHPDAEPNLPGTRCVLGVLSVWLRNVETPEVLFEPDRFERDPAYARHLADFNLLNYLIENGDMRGSNILASTDPSNRRVFSVDNGISFGEPIFNVFVPGWKELRVPALPRSAVARLRRLERDDADALAVVAEFHLGEDGVLREARPRAPLDPDRGSRFRDGVLQLGLTQHETEALWRRVESLLAVVREERIPVF